MSDTRDPSAPLVRQAPRWTFRRLSVRLWTFEKDKNSWSAELQHRGKWGIEAQIRRNGKLLLSRRFPTRGLAIEWAAEERDLIKKDLEKGID